jgi:D-alanyl-D-alanine carboxypeptidase
MYFAKNRSDFAANPGRSEHQLGTAMDLDFLGSKDEDLFIDSISYKWMQENAHKYGFVQSFDIEGEKLTGIPNEPWHWRFVGERIATKVKTEKLNLSQYLFDRKEAKKKGISL